MNAPSVQVQINGELRTVPAGQSLDTLVASLGVPPQTALVEHNGQALLRSEWAARPVVAGDQLEILRVVAGG